MSLASAVSVLFLLQDTIDGVVKSIPGGCL
jgi:hypothetical protein